LKPSPGRIVWYTSLGSADNKYPPQIVPAIVTMVNSDGTCALKAFYPTGIFDMASVSQTEEAAGSDGARGKWAWPARE
jgi:hypothetical protein